MSTVQTLRERAEEDIDTLVALLLRLKKRLKTNEQFFDLNVWLGEEGIEANIEKIITTDWNTFSDFSRAIDVVHSVEERLQAVNLVDCLFRNMQDIQNRIIKNYDNLKERRLTRLYEVGIRQLPDEILAHIFWSTNEPLLMSHVSRKFRSIAIAFPYLWSIPPFFPNNKTELYLLRSQNSPLTIMVPSFQESVFPLATSRTSFGKAAMTKFFTSLSPHITRCRTLTIQNLVSSLSKDFYALLKLLLMKSPSNSPVDMFPCLYSALIQVEVIDLLDSINPELAELEIENVYLVEEDNTLQRLKNGLRRFRYLQKLFLRGFASADFVWSDASAIDLPSLKSLTIDRTQLTPNRSYSHQDLSRILYFLKTPALTDLKLLVKFTNWKSLQPDNIFWSSLSSYRNLTHLTLDADVFNNQIGPYTIVATVLEICQSLIQFKLALVFCRGLDWLFLEDISNLSQNQTEKAQSFSDRTSQTWNLRCPLKSLYLRDCFDHQEDLKKLAQILVLSDNWGSFERLVLDTTTYNYATRTAGKLRTELEDFLLGLQKKLDGKVEWSLEPM